MNIIALTGPIGSGKSELAKYLMWDHGYYRYPFAAYLKRMLKEIGLSDEQLYGSLKETPCDLLCGKTPRYAMQTLGTEWRDMIGQDLWVKIWEHDVTKLKRFGGAFDFSNKIVVDDLRFQHEADAVHRLGGHVVKVFRPGVGFNSNHPSETTKIQEDFIVYNDADLIRLRARAKELEERYGGISQPKCG
jgi:hypothetical protein